MRIIASVLISTVAVYIVTILSQIDIQPSSEQNATGVPIANKAPTARITKSAPEIEEGKEITFFGTFSNDPDGKIVGYMWDFEDGTNGTGAKVTHVFPREAPYTVTLTVVDDKGEMNTVTDEITVYSQWQLLAKPPFSTLIAIAAWALPSGGATTIALKFIGRGSHGKTEKQGEARDDVKALTSEVESLKTNRRSFIYVAIAGAGCVAVGIALYFLVSSFLGIKLDSAFYLVVGIAASLGTVISILWIGRFIGEHSVKRALSIEISNIETLLQSLKNEGSSDKKIIEVDDLRHKVQQLESDINRITELVPQHKLITVRDSSHLEQVSKETTKEKLTNIGVKMELKPKKGIPQNIEIEDLMHAVNRLEGKRDKLLQEKHTFDREAAILMANYYFYTGRFDEASRLYDDVLLYFPGDFDALINKGKVLYRLGRLQVAQNWIDQALQTKKDNPDALIYKAFILHRLYSIEEARPYYIKFLESNIDETDIDSLVNMAAALERLERKKEAKRYYQKAVDIKIDDKNADDLVNKGIAYDGLGKLEEARERHEKAVSYFDKALEIDDKNVFALYAKACSYALQGKFDDSLSFLEKVIDMSPGYSIMAKNDPDFEKLRDDERFKKLVAYLF
jgi:tetratricopeptide (TPR) repeat protein